MHARFGTPKWQFVIVPLVLKAFDICDVAFVHAFVHAKQCTNAWFLEVNDVHLCLHLCMLQLRELHGWFLN